ncbi:hypothetical protein BDN71DRAFT_248180 [Pleurotus eryngii]|uniref:Uncharacterized protein n=1 Tax=Pleurotus eryngii TaxID=5323 RepID=A0A9P5ZLD7_PLEER|nr:hypothetical protein BDN71DRAFT_248180 [Pleurotus eryngii]
MKTRDSADIRRSTPTYASEPTSIQDEPSSKIIHNTREAAQLGGTDISSLQEIPDEDDSETQEGAHQNASDTVVSPISLQADEKPHNLHKSDHSMGHPEVDPDVYLDVTDRVTNKHIGDVGDNVLGRGNRGSTDKGRKIAAVNYSPSDVVANGPKLHAHEVLGSVESSGVFEKGSGLNANLQNKVMRCLFSYVETD